MAGYIGKSQVVTQVNGYTQTEADSNFVDTSGDTMTGNLDVTGTVTSDGLTVDGGSGNSLVNFTPSGTYSTVVSFANAASDFDIVSYGSGSASANNFRIRDDGASRLNIAGNGDISFYEDTGTTAKFFWDASAESLGIGTSSPSSRLHIKPTVDSTNGGLRLESADGSQFATIDMNNAGNLRFYQNGTPRMRIDSSGNVLVGKTIGGAIGTAGIELRPNNLYVTSASSVPIYVNRNTNDGHLIQFRQDNETIGSIGSYGSAMYIGSGSGSDAYLRFTNNRVQPCTDNGSNRDNIIDLGISTSRFDDVYATNGTIQTSDRNEKQDIASLNSTEMNVAKRISAMFKKFRWIDSVTEKGANARTHSGVIAQDVQQAFTDEGLDAGDYSLFISTTWWETQTQVPAVDAVAEVLDDDGNVVTEAVEAEDAHTVTNTFDTQAEAPDGATERTRMGIRYPQLLSFLAAYNEQRFTDIEARLTALEAV